MFVSNLWSELHPKQLSEKNEKSNHLTFQPKMKPKIKPPQDANKVDFTKAQISRYLQKSCIKFSQKDLGIFRNSETKESAGVVGINRQRVQQIVDSANFSEIDTFLLTLKESFDSNTTQVYH